MAQQNQLTQPTEPVAVGPLPVAEPSSTTGEIRFAAGTIATIVVVGLVKFGVHLDANQQEVLTQMVEGIVATAVSFILSRGIRKIGTQG